MPIQALQLRNNCLVSYTDSSDIEYSRNGRISNLVQNQKTNPQNDLIELKKIKKIENIIDYTDEILVAYSRHKKELKLKTGSSLKELGTLSKSQVSKMRKCVESLINYNSFNTKKIPQNFKNEKSKEKFKKQNDYTGFITLTICASQCHTDTVLRRSLSNFLYNIQRLHGVIKYVWKAESQSNGNLHFHILIDRYIHHEHIRNLWNNELDKLGYLDKYSELRKKIGFQFKASQVVFSKSGEKSIVKHKKSREQQFNEYLEEKKNGFRNPNSTDIHSIYGVKDISSYVMKYLIKKDLTKRPVIGAIWGASNRLKKIDYPTFYYNDDVYAEIVQHLHSESNELIEIEMSTDYVRVFVGKVFSYIRERFVYTWSRIRRYYSYVVDEKFKLIKQNDKLMKELKESLKVVKIHNKPVIQNSVQLELFKFS